MHPFIHLHVHKVYTTCRVLGETDSELSSSWLSESLLSSSLLLRLLFFPRSLSLSFPSLFSLHVRTGRATTHGEARPAVNYQRRNICICKLQRTRRKGCCFLHLPIFSFVSSDGCYLQSLQHRSLLTSRARYTSSPLRVRINRNSVGALQ